MFLLQVVNNVSIFTYLDYGQWCLRWGNDHWYPLSCEWSELADADTIGLEIEIPMEVLKPLCRRLELLRSSGRLINEIESGLDYEEALVKKEIYVGSRF